MFLDLDNYDSARTRDNSRVYFFKLSDRHFSVKFTAPSPYHSNQHVVVEVIKTYKARNRHVAQELARYYQYLGKIGYSVGEALESHVAYVDALLPSIRYKELYYPLLKHVYLKKYVC